MREIHLNGYIDDEEWFGDEITPESLHMLLYPPDADDPEAQKLLDQEAVYLSAGLINLLNLIPVDSIYLAGDICCRHELLIGRLQREISATALYRGRNDTRILPVADTPNMGVLSAAEVVFSRFFTV